MNMYNSLKGIETKKEAFDEAEEVILVEISNNEGEELHILAYKDKRDGKEIVNEPTGMYLSKKKDALSADTEDKLYSSDTSMYDYTINTMKDRDSVLCVECTPEEAMRVTNLILNEHPSVSKLPKLVAFIIVEAKTYYVPVVWESWGKVVVKASCGEEAIRYAKNNLDKLPLPRGEYIEDSFYIDDGENGHANVWDTLDHMIACYGATDWE